MEKLNDDVFNLDGVLFNISSTNPDAGITSAEILTAINGTMYVLYDGDSSTTSDYFTIWTGDTFNETVDLSTCWGTG